MQHSDYFSGYMQLGEVIKTLSIHPQSFEISKQNFFDSPITELTSSEVKYTRAPLGARCKSAFSVVQTCQVNQTIPILANTLAIQLNKAYNDWITVGKLNARTNFNGKEDPLADWTTNMSQASQGYYGNPAGGIEASEHQCNSIMRICNLCKRISVSVSLLESTIEGKRHCGIFIDIPLCEIDRQAAAATVGTPFYNRIPFDITFSGVLDLNQLNPIFNSFPVLTHLKVVWLNKNDTIMNNHLAYHMIPPVKPDIVYLLAGEDSTGLEYIRYNVRIVNMQNAAIGDKIPQNSISQIGTAKFDVLEIQNLCFNIENEEAIIRLNLVINQNNVIPQSHKSLNQATNGQMFDCFVDQDVISAPSDLQHSLTFENLNIDDKKNYYGLIDNNKQYRTANIFYLTTMYSGYKAIKTLYPNKYMLAWKLATDDSFMRGFNSSKMGSRTNVQVILQGNLTKGIIDTSNVSPSQNQNDFKQFIGTRAYPDPTKASITPIMHYLCDAFVRIIFDDSTMPQVLNIDVIGELAGEAI
ncbi:MAG: hypothetical protein EZS28_019308, partial [Streblomastix strix]